MASYILAVGVKGLASNFIFRYFFYVEIIDNEWAFNINSSKNILSLLNFLFYFIIANLCKNYHSELGMIFNPRWWIPKMHQHESLSTNVNYLNWFRFIFRIFGSNCFQVNLRTRRIHRKGLFHDEFFSFSPCFHFSLDFCK